MTKTTEAAMSARPTITLDGRAVYEQPFRAIAGQPFRTGTWLTTVDWQDGNGPFVTIASVRVLRAFRIRTAR